MHLNVHSEYSLLDGACTIDRLLEKAREYKMPAIALTDHGNLFGAIEFYKKAFSAGIKPVIGCELYLTPGSMRDKDKNSKDSLYHVTLLAKNAEGYRNLIKLVSAAHLDGFYYKPRIDKELLSALSGDLVVLSGCLKGEVSRLVLSGRMDDAVKTAIEYRDIAGEGDFYLEVQDGGLEEQKSLNASLAEISKETGIPLVATSDCHYINREDARHHAILLCIQTATNLDDPKRMKFSTDEFYFRSPEDMSRLFSDMPEALSSTLEIADKCNLELELGRHYIPKFSLPEGKTSKDFIEELCRKGLEEKYPEPGDIQEKRLRHELDVIESMGFENYFLIVWDFVNYARSKKYGVGPGRGSAAGSLVSYALGITSIDPLKYDLIFERFLNKGRKKLPDIDIDFSDEHRGDVISYVRKKYGKDRVAQIITFGTMAARGAIRDVGRALGMSYAEVDRIAKLVPGELNIKLEDAMAKEPELKRLAEADGGTARLMESARALEGTVRHSSTHAAGIVISDRELTEYVPLMKDKDGEIVTQYPMEALESVGLLKMDFLGLKTLGVIQDALDNIKTVHGKDIDIESIPLDDEKTFSLLKDSKTSGVFQLESAGMRDLLRKLEPERLEDIIAVLALYRPGPLGSGMVNDFIQRKHGAIPVEYDHPVLEPILKETYGVILYQEQVMRIASAFSGLSLEQADDLQRAIGKKIPEIMDQQEELFVKCAGGKGINKKTAKKVFKLIAFFAGYGFNKAHSTAYAMIAYRTAYLKANYLREFYAALLSNDMGNTDKLTGYIKECAGLGLKVLPPDVNKSFADFTVEGDDIRFGLGAVKNVGLLAIKSIVETRKEKGEFRSIYDFCESVDLRLLNKRVVESLIKCGAFDNFSASRSHMFAVVDKAVSMGQRAQKDKKSGQASLFEGLEDNDCQGNGNSHYPDIEEWHEAELLSGEKEMLGFYISGHPLVKHEGLVRAYASNTTGAVREMKDGDHVEIMGVLTSIKAITTKSGKKMAYARVEDLEGEAEVIFFPGDYEKYAHLLEIDRIVHVTGKLDLRQDEPKISAETVLPLEDVERHLSKSAHIKLLSTGIETQDIEKLKDALLNCPGECPVYIHIVDSYNKREVVMDRNPILKIQPGEEVARKVKELLGEGAIYFRR